MTLAEIAALETAWQGRIPPDDPACFGWEPYSPDAFAALLEDCLPRVPSGNRTFLDAGCGIGTKCVLAAQAGLEAYGFDLVPEFLAEARQLGVACEQADARMFTRYGDFGLVYVNHPLVPGPGETALERRVHAAMAAGSVLMAVNYDIAPDWPEISRAGPWDAAWVKP
jgi:SAM-dependent methyltransferase